MGKITVLSGEKKFEYEFQQGVLLLDILAENNFSITAPCGGKGICGKCRVIVDGEECLACKTFAKDGMLIEIIRQGHSKILEDGIKVALTSHQDGYGIAFDIGTTTIVGYLYDLKSGNHLKSIAQLNEQRILGADVISRTAHSKKMNEIIIRQLNNMIAGFSCPIKKITIAGNTIMQHFVMELDASSIAVAPFTPVTRSHHQYNGIDLGLTYDCPVEILPCISGYVGADIVAGILASELYQQKGMSLLLDIGTNGEIVLGNKEKMFCCSTAAGPAFEGANISSGVGSIEGAINKVWFENGEVKYTTIGDKKPVGICGSGIIDLVAQLIEQNIVEESGYMEQDFVICEGISITPQDIREIQLAKAAISAGVYTIIEKAAVSIDEIEAVYLAGGFGSYMDKDSAIKIGLLPDDFSNKIKVVGNAAGSGASMALLSQKHLDLCTTIAQKTKYIELSSDLFFQNEYVNRMFFD